MAYGDTTNEAECKFFSNDPTLHSYHFLDSANSFYISPGKFTKNQ